MEYANLKDGGFGRKLFAARRSVGQPSGLNREVGVQRALGFAMRLFAVGLASARLRNFDKLKPHSATHTPVTEYHPCTFPLQ